MQKKTVTNFCRAFPLGLLLCLLVGVGPVFGQITHPDSIEALVAERLFPHQVTDDFRASIWVGLCFNAERSSEHCPLIQADVRVMLFKASNADGGRFQSGLFHPLMGHLGSGQTGVGLQSNVMYSSSDTWPDPPPPDRGPESNSTHSAKTGEGAAFAQQEQLKANHSGMTTITPLELLLVIPFQPRFLFEPFIGGGVAIISEGKAKTSDFAIEGKTMPAMSYGVGLTVRLGKVSNLGRVDLRFQFRKNVFVAGELTYIPLASVGEPITVDVGTISTSNLFFGVSIRFPKKSN